jgi:hypothetical protein
MPQQAVQYNSHWQHLIMALEMEMKTSDDVFKDEEKKVDWMSKNCLDDQQ